MCFIIEKKLRMKKLLLVTSFFMSCVAYQQINVPRVSLAFLPTPLHVLSRMTADLQGPTVLIKRDDQTGLGMGGNKTRKLEFLMAEALAQGYDTVITAGAVQSNHCRQTAAACAQCGLVCALLLHSQQPNQLQGNNLLNHIFGAQLYWTQKEGQPQSLEELADRLRAEGKKPYIVQIGGSNDVGALGYVQAMIEITEQLKAQEQTVTHIVAATGSAGTLAGLVVGAYLTGFTGKVIGISIDGCVDLVDSVDVSVAQQAEFVAKHVAIANKLSERLGLDKVFTSEDFTILFDYVAEYAVLGDHEHNAITYLAQTEGILLDPVYTGRAFGGLLDLIKRGEFTSQDTVLFVHTGGTPGLFAYAERLGAVA